MNALTPGELEQLRRFLNEAGEDVSGDLSSELLTGGRSNLTFLLRSEARAWVLRRPPKSGLTSSAHDVAREFKVCEALQGATVPVARTVGCDSSGEILGAPFAVVEYV